MVTTHQWLVFSSSGLIYPEPTPCGMVRDTCLNFVALWTVGNLGTCFSKEHGIPMGLNSMSTGVLQVMYQQSIALGGWVRGWDPVGW